MNTDPYMPNNERRFKLKHLLCSLLALTSSWPLDSPCFAYLNLSSTGDHLGSIRDIFSSMILTGVVYVTGWFVVGLPLALRGDRIFEKPIRTIVMAGIGGAATILIFLIVLFLPAVALTLLYGRGRARFPDLPQSRRDISGMAWSCSSFS